MILFSPEQGRQMNVFYVNKTNETFADMLLTLGWADLLRLALHNINKPNKDIAIHNAGASYEVILSFSLRLEDLHSEMPIPFLEPLISPKQDERWAKKGRVLQNGFHYDEQRKKESQLIEELKNFAAASRTPEANLRRDPDLEALRQNIGVRSGLAHYKAITMLKVPDTFNSIVVRWQDLSVVQQWLAIGLLYRLFSQRENDVLAAIKDWEALASEQGIDKKAMASVVQVINPTSGKGSNVSKSYRLTNGGLEGFWLLELLKFKGFMIGAAPYVLKGSKDRKTYVILPETVELETLTRIMDDFRRICWSSTAVKQDVLAALRLAQVLLYQRRTALNNQQNVDPYDEQPLIASIARGFDVASYKDMGSAHATMNVSTINMPTWFPALLTLHDVEEAELLLQEHIRLIRRIEGHQGKEGNDELELLRAYRDFLSGHDLRPFWKFAAHYSGYMFRQREHEKDVKRWLPQLTKKGLDILVMNHQNTKDSLQSILQNPGFQNIASAIREATVRAQRRRSQVNGSRYEVRYGLEQELLRKAHYRDDFMIALSKFIALYNAETAREEEKVARDIKHALTTEDYRTHKLRYPVTTEDINKLSELLDTNPTELVATMLIAYGYSRYGALKKDEVEVQAEITDDELEDAGNDSEEE
jgi:hypothetical protein